MVIKLRLTTASEPFETEVSPEDTIESLLKTYRKDIPYPVYAARLDNRMAELTEKADGAGEIVFLDMRDSSAKEIYQRSLIALFRLGLQKVLPGAHMIIGSSLNRGIFTEVANAPRFSSPTVEKIERVMKQLAKDDIPFSYIDHGDGMTVPSTGYIKSFDLRKCRSGIVIRIPEDTHPGGLAPYIDNKKLYYAFADEKKWTEKLGIKYCEDLNKKIRMGEINDIIRISEALQEKNIAKIADKIAKSGKRVVLITGPSSSGKTTFAKRLCVQLWIHAKKPVYMGTDDYYLARDLVPAKEDGTKNFEDLDAIDVKLFNRHINALLKGEEVDLPRFDFNLGRPVFGERKLRLSSGQHIVIEGIHALNGALTYEIDERDKFKIYISPLAQIREDDFTRIPLTDIRKLRRIVRDANKRGWDAKETIMAWPGVRAGEDKNIFPYSDEADVIFNSTLVYELAALKTLAGPMLKAIPKDDETRCEAERLLRLLDKVEALPGTDYIANDSIIREFIGGSVIV